MAMDTVAPWAETAPLTADILRHMPDDGWRYELVRGRLVRRPPTGYEHGRMTAILTGLLQRFAAEGRMGDVLGAETGFMLSREGEPDTVLAPDIAFISAARAPRGSETGFARVAPDLVVEVASPGQTRVQMDAKSRLYFQAGARAVWVVWPATRTVDIRQSGGSRTLGDDDVLEAEDILPGLRIGVRQLFG